MHDIPLDDIIEILKEELETYKFYIRAQAVQSISVETTKWFMYLYPDINLCNFKSLLRTSITYLINEEPIFALVRKTIFDSVINKLVSTTKMARSFTKKSFRNL